MNSLIAKVGRQYKRVVTCGEEIIENLSNDNIEAIDFIPNHSLDDAEEWFKLTAFSDKEYFDNVCDSLFSSASLNQIDDGDYDHISYLAILQGSQKHFQRITPSRFIDQITFLDFSGEPKIVEQRKQLEIKQESDAIYFADSDILYFKKISKAKFFFPGIEELHREATQIEVDTFLGNGCISLNDFSASSVGVANRKRIADVGLKFQQLTEDKKSRLIKYARKHAGIVFREGKFIVSSDQDLKKLLYAMDQRYYYADVYEENRFANSVRKVRSGEANG